jgi:hypothetical protein
VLESFFHSSVIKYNVVHEFIRSHWAHLPLQVLQDAFFLLFDFLGCEDIAP